MWETEVRVRRRDQKMRIWGVKVHRQKGRERGKKVGDEGEEGEEGLCAGRRDGGEIYT
jgi:hypothetical protein